MKRELKKTVSENIKRLLASDKSLRAVYEISFSAEDNVFAETSDGYRIKKMTYGELKKISEQYSEALYSRLGAHGCFIGLEMENRPEWIAAFWAILRSGNKPYLVNCRHPEALSNGILSELGIRYIVSDGVGRLNAEYITLDELAAFSGGITPPEESFENEIALSTSGTSTNETICFFTGAELSEQILNSEPIIKKCPSIAADCDGSIKLLAFLPFYHIFGLSAVYFWFAFFGRTFVFLRELSAETLLRTCRRHRVTHIFAVPMLWHTVEKQLMRELDGRDEADRRRFEKGARLSLRLQNAFPRMGGYIARRIMREVNDRLFGDSVRFMISGGSALRPSAIRLMCSLGYPLHNGYGMSEIGIASVELGERPSELMRGSVGAPFRSLEYSLGEDGTLLVRGSSICGKRRINGTEYSADGLFDTGDLAELRDGVWYITGRRSDTVIGDNGENINPDAVEACFELPFTDSFSVLGLDRGEGEELSLVVRIGKYTSGTRLEAIAKKAYDDNSALPLASSVKRFYFTEDELAPASAVKIGRKYLARGILSGDIRITPFAELLERLKDGAAENGDCSASPELIAEITRTVAELLGIPEDRVGLDSHIVLELGATSLQYFSLLSALAEKFRLSGVSERERYRYTVRELAEYIEGRL